MRAVIGLGNPGREYERTRHNLGFRTVDLLADQAGALWAEGKGEYLVAEATGESGAFILLKPLTYVNRSGIAVREALEHFPLSPGDMLVVVDDVCLPLGRLRMRRKGSDGGHKGLASIIYELGTELFPRLRLGIGSPPEGVDLVSYVLGEFGEDELDAVNDMLSRAAEVAKVFIAGDVDRAIDFCNAYQGSPPP